MARTESYWEPRNGGTYIKTISPVGYDILINGTSKYLNFNTISGLTGYGFRDNAGVMEVKDSGGSWSEILSSSELSTSYLKLDQTTPQTTTGTFTFPKVVGTTDITTPLLIGGSAVGSKITYKSTTGAGTTSGVAHQWLGGTDGGTVIATMLNTGNVGIGTTSPTYKVDIVDITSASTTGTDVLRLSSHIDWSVVGSGPVLTFSHDDVPRTELAAIRGYTFASSDTGLSFETGFGALTPKMVIRNNGNVGIGTTAPLDYLEVVGGTNVGTMRVRATSSLVGYGQLIFDRSGATSKFKLGMSGTDYLTIDSANGNVGIGTTGPGSMLEVAGAGQFGTAGATTAQLTVLGGASGTPLISLQRTVGTTARFDWALTGGTLAFNDATNGGYPLELAGGASQVAAYIGQRGAYSNDARTSLLSASTQSATGGADQAGVTFTIQGGLGTGAGTLGNIYFNTGVLGTSGTTPQTASTKMTILGSGNVGIGTTAPTSKLHLAAGTATAGTAPLGFTSGTLLTTPVAGKVEFLTDAYYGTITTGAVRKTFAFLESPVFTTPNVGVATATQYKLSALNTAPANATDTGTLGEIRIVADAIYVCIATDTWVKANLATW